MKVSESMKAQITAAKQRITAAQSEIGQLMAKGQQQTRPEHEKTANRISELQRKIASAQGVISDNERRLPMMEATEKAAEAIERDLTEKERQQAAADRAAHDQAVRSAALAEWLKVPGQTQTGFESAWSGIAQQIATNRAVAAGAAETVVDHVAPIRQAAADALAARYGKVAQ